MLSLEDKEEIRALIREEFAAFRAALGAHGPTVSTAEAVRMAGRRTYWAFKRLVDAAGMKPCAHGRWSREAVRRLMEREQAGHFSGKLTPKRKPRTPLA